MPGYTAADRALGAFRLPRIGAVLRHGRKGKSGKRKRNVRETEQARGANRGGGGACRLSADGRGSDGGGNAI